MTKRRNLKDVFAIDRDRTRLFVRAEWSGIHPLVIACDGLTLTYFGWEDGPYLDVEIAAAWHEKELRKIDEDGRDFGCRKHCQKNLDIFRRALEAFRRGETEFIAQPRTEGA
jgi:hypothetical protein